ncbi:MAG: type I restriction-modification enzyme R subunit C-terminal domain-containing protein [Ignavibacteria bacterium]
MVISNVNKTIFAEFMTFPKFRVMNLFNIVLLILILIQYYLLTPLNNPLSDTFISMGLSFENSIKLIPGLLIPYFSIYVLIVFLIFSISRKKETGDMSVFLISILLLWSIVNFAHGFFPVMNTLRPDIKSEGFFFDAIRSLYKSVKPYNTMPSWHVATAILCGIVYYKLNFKRHILVIVWIVLICLSPLFLKMAYLVDILVAIPLPFLCYALAEKISTTHVRTETVKEIVKSFTLESLVQSVAIGIRDETTISSLIDNLTRIEKNLTEKDKVEIKKLGSALDPPVATLKEILNDLILSIDVSQHIKKAKEMFGKENKSYDPSDRELKEASDQLINAACRPLDNPKFRYHLLQIKKQNTELINTSSIEEASMERSQDIIFKFTGFIDSRKKDIPALKTICNSTNGHHQLSFDDIKSISKELRQPPYEISPDEIWNAYYRTDSTRVKPLGAQKNPTNLISLTQFAIGKTDTLEPYADKVDKKFQEWIVTNHKEGKVFTEEELEWLKMMKNYIASFLEINMFSFNEPPFVNKGGAAKAYNIFGPDLNRIIYELNEKLG